MDKVIKNKRGLELVTSHSSSQNQKNSFICYILSDQVWWCNVKQFLSYSKNCICKFMQANSWHKLLHFHFSFWIWKVWKGRGKFTKIWISKKWKEFFRWKNIFCSFWRAIIWWNNNTIVDTSFKCLLDVFWTALPTNPSKSLWWSFFCKDSSWFLAVNRFCKKAHHRFLSGF